MIKSRMIRRILAGMLSFVLMSSTMQTAVWANEDMFATLEEGNSEQQEEQLDDESIVSDLDGELEAEASGYGISNPRIVSDSSMKSKQVVTYDCIYFGNYWQEDTNGDGKANTSDKKQPIKWRVLSVDGDDAFLLADRNLDCQRYNTSYTTITWEKSTIRSWLNGYGSSINSYGTDYSSNNFIDAAFSSAEQSAIYTSDLVNANNSYWGTDGGNDTKDKVFLLSESDVYNTAYGFVSSYDTYVEADTYDEARRGKNTSFAKTRGAWTSTSSDYEGNGDWWMRSPGVNAYHAAHVYWNGSVSRSGARVDNSYSYGNNAVRPALHLNLSSSLWKKAGTVKTSQNDTPGTDDQTGSEVEITLWGNQYNSSSEKDDHTILGGGTITTDKGNVFETGSTGASKGKTTLDTGLISDEVTVTKENFITRSILKRRLLTTENGKTKAKPIYMEPQNSKAPTVLSVWVDDVDVRHEDYNLPNTSKDSITLEAEVSWGSSSEGQIFLYQNGKEQLFTGDSLTTVISNKFDTASTIYICAKDGDGRVTKKPLKFKNQSGNFEQKALDGFSVSLGDKFSTTLPKSIPLVGGDKLSMGCSNPIPITYTMEDGKVYVAIGMDLASGSGDYTGKEKEEIKTFATKIKEAYKQTDAIKKVKNFKDAKKRFKPKKASLGYEFDTYIMGFAEGTYDETGQIHFLDGGIIFDFSATPAKLYSPFTFLGVPMYVEGSLSAEVEAKLNLAINSDAKKFVPNGDISGTIKAEFGICAGVKDVLYAGGGVTGKLSPNWIIRANEDNYFRLKASLDGYVKAGVLFYEKKEPITIAEATWFEHPKPGANINAEGSENENSYEMQDFHLKNLTYLDTNGEAVFDMLEEAGDSNRLASNVYRESEVSYVKTASGDRVAFWIDSEDSNANNLQLYYSINKSGTWSTPKKVLNDGTADYMPVAMEYNGTVAVAWMNATKSFVMNDELTLDDVAANMEIKVAILKGTAFSTYSLNSTGCDMLPRLDANGSSLCVAWVNNSDSHLLGDGNNNIQYAVYDGTSFGSIQTAYSTLSSVDGFAMKYDGTVSVAYTQDTDGDADTIDDIRLYENGVVVGASEFVQIKPVYSNGTLYWYSNGNICSRGISCDEQGMIPLSNYKLVSENGHMMALYINRDNASSSIYASVYDEGTNTWSSPVLYNETGADTFAFDVIEGDGKLEFLSNEITGGEEGQANIYVSAVEAESTLQISFAGYDPEDFEPGNDMPIDYIVLNEGMRTVNGFTLTVKDKDGVILASETITDSIVPNGEYDGVISIEIPEDSNGEELRITCSSDDTHVTSSEEYVLTVKNDNVYIDNSSLIIAEDGNIEIRCGIGNSGKNRYEGAKVTLREKNASGDIIETKSDVTFEPGTFTDLLFVVPKSDTTVYYLSIEDLDDSYAADNSVYLLTTSDKSDDDEPIIAGPRFTEDETKQSGMMVTYDCVYFGSYPNAEVIPDKSKYNAINSKYLQDNDLIVDADLYKKLQNTEFDTNGIATVAHQGKMCTYKRIKKSDAVHGLSGKNDYYNWSDSTTYHYFRCEPIKWRVLYSDDDQALLLADRAIDEQHLNRDYKKITWETSAIRSWLNGYAGNNNADGTDYTKNSFIDVAFSSTQKDAICITELSNPSNLDDDVDGGNDTEDKVFLLSQEEAYSSEYGFVDDQHDYDEVKETKSPPYAKAMGIWWSTGSDYSGNSYWWLRSPGADEYSFALVSEDGCVARYGYGEYTSNYTNGVRPALYLDLTKHLHSYAGTVNTDGETADDPGYPDYPDDENSTGDETVTITFDTNGGNVIDTVQIKKGSAYGTLPTTEKDGYTFLGWFTELEGGQKITETDIATEDTTLYAHWEKVGSPDPTDNEEIKIVVKQKVQLSAAAFHTTETIDKYEVMPKGAASVSKAGLLVGKKVGEAQIIAKKKDGKQFIQVGDPIDITIEKPVMQKQTSIKKNEVILPATVLKNTTIMPDKWVSSKPSVASVNELTGEITVLDKGSTKITAYFGEGAYAAKYATTISVKVPEVAPKKATIVAGKSKQLKIKNTTLPVTAWKSSDESVMKVDEKGLVTAISAGTATISATVDGVDYSGTFTVKGLAAGKHLLWFDANGGTVTPANRVVTEGKPYGNLPVPQMEGHTFQGWYTAKIGGTLVNKTDVVSATSDQVVYARWDNSQNDKTVIVLDPGHGDSDNGSTSQGVTEKEFNLLVSKQTKDLLTEKGYEVYLTREDDSYISSQDRVLMYADKNPAAIISIHADGGTEEAQKVCAYYSVDGSGETLASSITSKISEKTGMDNDGVITRKNGEGKDYYAIIRNARELDFEGVQVSIGGINEEYASLYQDEEWINKVSQGLAEGIDAYL